MDTTHALDINGTLQPVRLRAAREDAPPVLVVQGGPGLPLLNEVKRFHKLLRLESDFLVAYWDQRGCGPAARRNTEAVSLETQIADVRTVIRWLATETYQEVVVLAISLGATAALQAVARDSRYVRGMVAVSIDTDIAAGDAATLAFLQQASMRAADRGLASSIEKLGLPPYTTTKAFQLRVRLLSDCGGIEHGRRFGQLLRTQLLSQLRTYGPFGTIASLRNMNALQQAMLPEMASFNLFDCWPQPGAPVHYVFGDHDPFVSPSIIERLGSLMTERDTIARVPEAGHLVHFDQPDVVRAVVVRAHAAAGQRREEGFF